MQLLPLVLLFVTTLPAPPPQVPIRVLPFELHQGSVWMPVKVNGSRPLWFELDTGSSLDVLDRTRAEQMGLPIEEHGHEPNAGVGDGMTRMATTRRVALDIAGLLVVAERVEVLDLSPIAKGKPHRMDGMVGATLLDRFVVKIDYEARRMSLYDPAGFVYDGPGEVLPLRPVAGTLHQWAVRVDVVMGLAEPVEGDFIVDSPVSLPAVLAGPFVRENMLLTAARQDPFGLQSGELVGLGGTSRAWIGRVDELRLGSLVLTSPVVAFSNARGGVMAGHRIAGILGGGALSKFRVIFDCARHRIIFESTLRGSGEPLDAGGLPLGGTPAGGRRLAPDALVYERP
jgi:hypothetical protein